MKRLAALSQRVCAALILLAACPLAAPAATQVDLSGVVNNGLEDDGIIGNGAGGDAVSEPRHRPVHPAPRLGPRAEPLALPRS